ncbi:MAG TPA: hemolysin family protein [Streptosporangiaceae bacterium]|nr:hemolysin family protein [Streptosporangiaceae bacterium]
MLIADIVIVLVIVLIGGFFAASEMALVSLREGQIHRLSQRGKRGQKAAKLAQDPNRFLSSVQIGVTLATLVSGVYGSATLVGFLERELVRLGMASGWADAVAFVVVTVLITFVTLILGELAPKRIALQRVEAVSLLSAPTLDRISVLARPLVWLLSASTDLVVRILGGNPKANRNVMTEEELRDLVVSNQALSADERRIVGEVFDAGKRQIREVLRPRTEVEFVEAELPLSEAANLAVSVPYSRLPVYQGSYDNVIGFVHVRDLLDPSRANRPLTVGQVSRHVKFMPNSKTVLAALSEMRRERAHLAIVVDEYGGTAGIVTLEDLVEELIGDIRDEYDVEQDQPRRLLGGAVEVDGLLNLHEFAEQTGIALPEGPYETAAGFVLAGLGEVPEVGNSVEVDGSRLTVTEMDGRRIARLRIAPAAHPEPPDTPPAAPAATPSTAAPSPSPAPLAPAPTSTPPDTQDPPAPLAAQDPPAPPAAQDPPAPLAASIPPNSAAPTPSPAPPAPPVPENGQSNGQSALDGQAPQRSRSGGRG